MKKSKNLYLNNKINSKLKNELAELSNKNKDIKLTKITNCLFLVRKEKLK